jgi:hypothetical protein
MEGGKMKIDLYTKVILTVIALALIGNLLKSVLTPPAVQARNGGKFEHLQSSVGFAVSFFDTRTGELWSYYEDGPQVKVSGLKLIELGKPLQEIKAP